MARYTFTCEHFDYNDFNGDEQNVASKHTTEFRADTLETMLENFEMFLRGAGFQFDGVIDVISPEENDIEEDLQAIDEFVADHQSERVMDHIVKDLMRQNDQKESVKLQDKFGDVFVSDDSMGFPFAAAQSTLTITSDEYDPSPVQLNLENETCSLCKLPVSVMKRHQCFDPSCPSGAYRNQHAN
jgi:hypothetical protein